MNKIIPGVKYYKHNDDGSIEIIRVNKVKETGFSVCDETGKIYQKTKEEIVRDYTLLRPDGYITFMILNLANNIKDVALFLHRKEDVEENAVFLMPLCSSSLD